MEKRELETRYMCDVHIKNSFSVFHEMRDIKSWDKEVFVGFYMDTNNKILSREIIGIGTLNGVMVHVREVYKTAISRNANSIIVAHNHPSGSIVPSKEDIQLTRRLREAGKLIGIELLDHVIVTNEGYFSFSDTGQL